VECKNALNIILKDLRENFDLSFFLDQLALLQDPAQKPLRQMCAGPGLKENGACVLQARYNCLLLCNPGQPVNSAIGP